MSILCREMVFYVRYIGGACCMAKCTIGGKLRGTGL